VSDRVSRIVAITALVLAVLALAMSTYAVSLAGSQTEALRELSRAMSSVRAGPSVEDLPMHAPPPQLETDY
jgi:HAMP domain-containing protein